MTSTKRIIILLSCVLSLGLSAQETYTWAGEVGKYTMYTHGFFNDNVQKLFSIPDSLFTHNNMTGNTNFVYYFEFTEDRTQVFFLESQGDLYLYTVDVASLQFLGDLTPEISPGSIHGYTKTLGLTFINDSTLYIYGQTYGTYNINSGVFTKIRQPSSLLNSISSAEKEITSRGISKYKRKFLYNASYPHINELFPNNPDTNKIIFKYDSIWRGATDITTYQHDCDSTFLYVLANSYFRPINKVHRYWYKIDMNTGKATYSHPSIKAKFLDLLTIPLQTKHYNSINWEDCQRLVDLDFDDSSESDLDFLIDGLCYHSGIPLCDTDVKVSNELPLDSIDIEIQNPRFGQELYIPPDNYKISIISPTHQRLINSGSTSNLDFENAIINSLYIDNGAKKGGEVRINFTAWYGGIAGRTATANLKILNPLPNAGEDINIEFCQNNVDINILNLISIQADTNGDFFNKDGNKVSNIITLNNPQETTIYYIVDNKGCTDTAQIIIDIHQIPVINPIKDTIICYGDNIVLDFTNESGIILWNDSDTSKIKILDLSGQYSYTLTNEYLCENMDTFKINVLPQAHSNPVEAKVCNGEVFQFKDKEYAIAGVYHDTLRNQKGCDSIIFDINLRFFDNIPVDYAGELGFCEGETTEITITSNHNNLKINDKNTDKLIKISDASKYTITGYDKNGCIEELELNIIEYPTPVVTTQDLLDITYHSGIELPVQYSGNIVNYNWMPKVGLDCYDCSHPKLLEMQDGIFTIEVANQYGCTDIAELELKFKKVEINIPNVIYKDAYNPNNGIFYITSNSEIKYDLKIFNRWGNLLFSKENLNSNNPNDGWRPKGEVNSGVFVYMITIKEEEKDKVIAGDITVL